MKCTKCLLNDAVDGGELCQSCRDEFGQYYVHLILERTDELQFGVVRATTGGELVIPENCPITGYWEQLTPGDISITLMSPIQAMQDKLTNTITAYVIEKKKKKSTSGASGTIKKTPEPTFEPNSNSTQSVLNSLRALFPPKQ